MVSYESEIQIRTTALDSATTSLIALAAAFGGYLESRFHNHLVLRIPVGRYKTVFDSILATYDISTFTQHSSDITDAFVDTEARIAILKKTIARLRTILGRTRAQEAQIQLLDQIKNLAEELEIAMAQLDNIRRKASFSSITIVLIHHTPDSRAIAEMQFPRGFEWMRKLDYASVSRKKGRSFTIGIPAGMVYVKKVRSHESAGGTKVWARHFRNDPRGTTEFWSQAVRHSLKGSFHSDTSFTVGRFTVVEFHSFPGRHFVYSVAVRVRRKRIDIVETYYPSTEQWNRFGAPVAEVLRRRS